MTTRAFSPAYFFRAVLVAPPLARHPEYPRSPRCFERRRLAFWVHPTRLFWTSLTAVYIPTDHSE
ncbi:hypothetical protein HanPSC8_Chr10g0404961 [Helianthus annuus]|nr:hypothetical protein HanPSC8_Chr10g0404961 [Helianthus annuus]